MELLIITICRATIDAFKASWPCHSIPADADAIIIAVQPTGPDTCELVDIDIEDSDGKPIFPDVYPDAGSALIALAADAFSHHKTQPMEPGTIASNHRSY